MITLKLEAVEYYDEATNSFMSFEEQEVDFEFTLKDVALWESKWGVAFLSTELKKNDIRLLDFFLMMSRKPDLPVEYFVDSIVDQLSEYLSDPQSPTTFASQNEDKHKNVKIHTADEIYAMMFMNHIPIEFEDRNLNRLLGILRIISVYSNPPKKMSKQEVLAQNVRLNAERKAKYNTRG